jgi:tRNA dimethylallyltransferase
MNRLITILGPTATGKTALAAELANLIGGEIISADSRQVYRGMDLGTGKDIEDYVVDGRQIPYHLIDIHEPGYEFNIFEFQKLFVDAFRKVESNGNIPILCGGSGMYLDSVLRAYEMKEAPVNKSLRDELMLLSDEKLIARLKSHGGVHNTTDTLDRERLVRAIEIHETNDSVKQTFGFLKKLKPVNFGISFERQKIRERITQRLESRLENGMLDEVRTLLEKGFTEGQLTFYGLEYRYLTLHVVGKISYDEMFARLNTAIHQFAKKQMTWFRRMEKNGVHIFWIDGNLTTREKLSLVLQKLPR